MKSELGLLGAFVLAFGGAILFEALYQLFYIINHNSVSDIGPPSIISDIIGFWGFLFVGLGLWLIVQSGKREIEQN